MKFFKILLFKFSRWWKYYLVLVLVAISFSFAKFSLAYSDNFDSYSNTYAIYQSSAWSTSASVSAYPFVSSFRYNSNPYSLYITGTADTGQTSYARYLQDDIAFSTASFNINFSTLDNTITADNSIYGAEYTAPSTNLRSWTLYFSNSQVLLTNGTLGNSTATTTVFSGATTLNTWVPIDIILLDTTIKACYNSVCSTDIPLINDSPDRITFASRPDYSNYYIDDFFANENTDNINFINPIDSSILSVNDFYWEYNLKIATSSYWTTYEFLNVDLGFFHYTGGVVDATNTLSVLREPMNTFVPNTFYNEQITDQMSFPNQLGSYQAVITLKGVYSNGTTDTLAYDTLTFGIATTTAINPSAWCSGLCNDIATATDWIGQIGNGVNCALRSATCYTFSPHQYNLDQFYTQYNNFTLVFPFNTFFDLASTTKNAFASSTINNNQTVGLPNIRKTGTTTEYYIQPLLGSSTMSSFIGSSNANLLRNTISYLLYGLIVSAILLIIW